VVELLGDDKSLIASVERHAQVSLQCGEREVKWRGRNFTQVDE
jgi:hypothetical protein